MSKAAAARYGITPEAEILAYGQVAGPDPALQSQPSNAINKALGKAGVSLSDIKLFEINEAFAAVALAAMNDLGISEDIVNVNGGAIALGHPIGASGARITLTLARELKRRGGGLGAVGICGGGGQGDSLIIRV
jgi:acetyl-CoA C-acetyltransferase